MAKIRKIYDQTIKPDGSKTTIYPITSTRAVYTPEGETLDSYLKDGYFHGADLRGYKTVSNVTDLPTTENQFGWLIGEDLYVWVGTGGDTLGGLYQNCGHFRTPYVPDDEDLVADSNNELKLKDRTVEDGGMGYVILRRDKAFSEQVVYDNTIYEIRYNFDLDNTEIAVPSNCSLKFNGGAIANGVIDLNGAKVIASSIVFFNAITNNIGNRRIESCWYDWNAQDRNGAILQAIFDSLYANGGGIFVLSDTIHFNDTVTIKTVSDNSYTGSCIKIVGYNSEETGLVHHGNSNGIECVGYNNAGSSASACNVIIENTNISNITESPSSAVAAIKLAGNQRGAHFYLKNVGIKTTKTANNYGFVAETIWTYSFIDCFVSSYIGISINGGTSAYFNNVFFTCTYSGLDLCSVYCNIDNIFGDFATGTMFTFKFCTANINSIAAESPGLSCFISASESYLNIRNAVVYRPTSDNSVIFTSSSSKIIVDYLRLPKHNITDSSVGWLVYQPFDSIIIINDMDIEGIPFKHYSEQSERGSYIYAGRRKVGFYNPGVKAENPVSYYDWYIETPTQKIPQITSGYSSPLSNSAGTNIEWQNGPGAGALMLNSAATSVGTPVGWIKNADGLYRNSGYRPIPAVDAVNSTSDLPASSYKGACILCNGKPVWYNGSGWVYADGTAV